MISHHLDPATTGAPTADPDSDTIPNAMEFILGGDPTLSSVSILPILKADSGWRFRFLRHIDTCSAFNLGVEGSADLFAWEPLEHGVGGVTITVAPFNASHDQVDVLLPNVRALRRFLRLAAEPLEAPESGSTSTGDDPG